MKRLKVVPSWSFLNAEGAQLNPQLFDLLAAIHELGKLTQAAERVGISYRHGWNIIHDGAEFFGVPLVAMEKGRGARLTSLGLKLLWAEQRVMARLGPQLESLATELTLEIRRELEQAGTEIRLYASFGYAVGLLPQFITELPLNLQYVAAEDALMALQRSEADIAGIHIPVGLNDGTIYRKFRRLLKDPEYRVLRFITRQQGLITAPGNPRQLQSLADLCRDEIRFVNRRPGSGTRELLDQLLSDQGIRQSDINGYSVQEFTHSAVAAYVASGMADTGLGVAPAARQFGLDFVPLAREFYLLILRRRTLESEPVQKMVEIIRTAAFQAAVGELPGYQPEACGEIQSIDALFAALQG